MVFIFCRCESDWLISLKNGQRKNPLQKNHVNDASGADVLGEWSVEEYDKSQSS